MGKSQWTFKWEEKTIRATIADESFLEKIHQGEGIKAGDYIKVLLEVTTDLDEDQNPIYGSTKYTIVEVHGDILHSEPEQLQLEL